MGGLAALGGASIVSHGASPRGHSAGPGADIVEKWEKRLGPGLRGSFFFTTIVTPPAFGRATVRECHGSGIEKPDSSLGGAEQREEGKE